MTLLAIKPVFLVTVCAAAYGVSAIAMNAAATRPTLLLYGIIAVCLCVAALSEIVVLRHLDLGVTYVAILGVESVLVIALAAMIGESLGPRELAGAALVLAGTAILGA